MKSLMTNKCNFFLAAFLITAFIAHAQKQSKNYKETFSVSPEVSININTSYADVEFDTWNKNTVEVTAEIEVEGVSRDEAEKIFNNWNFEAIGNSGEVTISTKPAMHFRSGNVMVFGDDHEFEFVVPELPEIPEIPEIPEVQSFPFKMPPMPPMPMNFNNLNFDYEAYKKDGDKYLKEWKEEFNKNFDEDFKKNLEEWKNDMERYKADKEKMKLELQEHRKEMGKVKEEVRKQLVIQRKEIAKVRSEAHKARKEVLVEWKRKEEKSDDGTNVFFIKSKKGDENLKVKKTIKVKMPKGAKLKMNVRHGEVKIVDATKNINATLSHTRLHAHQVDGEGTFIKASYSPVIVDNWNYGELSLNYVKEVELKNVKSVKLNSKSSDVVIGTILGNAIIDGSFGDLLIADVAPEFKNISINLDNTDAVLTLPKAAFNFYCNAVDSKVTYPTDMVLDVSRNYNSKTLNGYRNNKNGNKTINIVAVYSDVEVQ